MQLILASTSIYRKAQLQQLGLDFLCQSPEVDESVLKNKIQDPRTLSIELSRLKAQAVLDRHPNAVVIGADQVCCLQTTILSKPGNKTRAHEQLAHLQGKTHSLLTSFCILSGEQQFLECVEAQLTMRNLSSEEINRYLDHDEPYQCCGSYRLESLGISLFESIECTDHTSIIGLPLLKLGQGLRQFGIELP